MPSRRVLITGGSGFVGQWMCRRLLGEGHQVFAGTVDDAPAPSVLTAEERDAVRRLSLDVTSADSIASALDDVAPDCVVHLAGIAFSPDASASPIRAFEVNALGAFRLLTRLAITGASATRVLIVGSAEQYGAHPDSEQPLGESAAQAPLTVYAASKATQEVIALQMARAGQHVVCTRSFNHAGVGQNDRFLFPALVARAKGLPRGGAMALGNSAPVRDYLHVADVVAAYDVLLERGVPGQAYNVCSGIRVTIREIAERVLRRLGVAAEITTDATLVRDVDVPVLVGDNAKLRSATGWAPRFSIDDIIDDVIHGTTR